MTEAVGPRVVDFLEPKRAEMRALLIRLVRAESPSTEPSLQVGVLEILSEALQERGFRPRWVRGKTSGGMLIALPADRPRHRPFQLVVGHCDTVWPTGTLASMPIREESGKLWGPGAYDTKAGLVQGLFAVEALQAVVLGDLPVTPVFFINSDEEIGSDDSTPLLRRLARGADRCFVVEPSLGPEGSLKTARKGRGEYTDRIRGKAAHAGLDPGKGASAILELSHVTQKLFELHDEARGVTVNVGLVAGGVRPNVIAPESTAVVEVRALTDEDAIQVERAIHRLKPETPGTSIAVESGVRRPPMEQTPRNRQLWRLAQEAAQDLDIDLREGTAGGASDGNTTSQFTATLDGLGAVGGGAHADDEHLILEKMVERAALLASLLSSPPL